MSELNNLVWEPKRNDKVVLKDGSVGTFILRVKDSDMCFVSLGTNEAMRTSFSSIKPFVESELK